MTQIRRATRRDRDYWLTFLRALGSSEQDALLQWLATHKIGENDLRWLWQMRLAAYCYHRFNEEELWSLIPVTVRRRLETIARTIAIEAALRLNELESVLAVLNEAAVDFVVMKGITVAQAAYPYAGARFSSDIDLWILPEASGHASQQLEGIGYRRLGSPLRPTDYKLRYGGVIKLGGNVSQGQGMIEIQWPAIRGEWVRRVSRIDHEAIWARRNPFPVGGQRAWMMSPEDLLIHLSVHAGINHQLAIWLAALLDLHLLISNTPAFNWRVVVERACAWQLRSLLWTVLGTTQHLFGTSIPASFFDDLRPPRLRRELLASLDPVEWLIFEEGERQLNHRRFLIQLALIDRPHDGLRLMRHALFPDAEWLRLRYDATTTRQLWNERLRHPLRVLLRAEV